MGMEMQLSFELITLYTLQNIMQTWKCKVCWLWGGLLKVFCDTESPLKLTQCAKVLLASKYQRPNFVGAEHNYTNLWLNT